MSQVGYKSKIPYSFPIPSPPYEPHHLIPITMSPLEYLAVIAFLDWCASHPPKWHPPRAPQDIDPTKEMQGWMTKPWVADAINRFFYFILGGLITISMITHHNAAFSLMYGPFMCIPAYRV